MLTLINSHISRYLAISPSCLYGNGPTYEELDLISRSGIYAITYSSCLRFSQCRIRIVNRTVLQIGLEYGGKRIDGLLDLAAFWYASSPMVRRRFRQVVEFNNWLGKRNFSISKVEVYRNDLFIRISHSADNSISEYNLPTEIFVYHLINALDLDAVITNEIVYLGLSRKSIRNRVAPHNKWGEIAEMRNRDMDSLIYGFDVIHEKLVSESSIQTRSQISDISEEDLLCLAEMHLIWMLKPRYNDIYKDDIPVDSVFLQRAAENGYDAQRIEVELDGQLGFISGSQRIPFKRMECARPWKPKGPAQGLIRSSNNGYEPFQL